MTEATIGGVEWKVGQSVRWVGPDGRKAIRTIVEFFHNTRSDRIEGVLDNRVSFAAEDVERRYVEACRSF